MVKRSIPIITNTEILARAIRCVDDDLQKLEMIGSQLTEKNRAEWLDPQLAPLKEKREALKMLYCIETGTDYD